MKKSFLAFALCAAVCLTAGCGDKNVSSGASNTANTSNTVSTQGTSTTVSTPDSSPAESTSDTATSESTPEASTGDSTPEAESNGITRGKWNGDVFTSDFFGFTVTLDQDCDIATDEDLAVMNGLTDMTDESFANAMENTDANTAVYDLFAQYHGVGNIALAYNKYPGMSLDDYVEANANGLKLVDAFKDTKTGTIKVGGERQACIFTTLVSGTAEVKEIMIMYNNGDYFAILTFGAIDEGDLNNMVASVAG